MPDKKVVPLVSTPVSPGWTADLVPANTITPQAIRWLWWHWIPLGKLTIFAGAGGGGKTTATLGFIATMTSGGRWPDGTHCTEKRSAIVWSSEDDPADTIVPRLIAAGAELARVYILQGRVNAMGDREPFDPAKDLDLLALEMERIGDVGMIMIDPIVCAVAGDMHKANDTRRSLQPLVDLAERHGTAVVGITHFAKGSQASNPAERVIGSQAFSALARMVLVAAKQEDSASSVIARAKSNISVDDGGVTYTIEPCIINGSIETTRVLWGDTIEGTAREILADIERLEEEEQPDDDDPSEALRRILGDGRLTAKEATKAMTDCGYTAKQTRTARGKIGVTINREGFGKDSKVYWSLPPYMPNSTIDALSDHRCPPLGEGKYGEKGHLWEQRASMEASEIAFDDSDSEEI